MTTSRDNEIKTLLATIDSLNKTIVDRSESNAKLQEVITKLQAELVAMHNKFEMFFGKKSEKSKKKVSDSKTNETVVEKPKVKKEVNGGGGRNEWPSALPRIETIIDPPEEERTCKDCGAPFRWIGAVYNEILHFKPMELYVEKQIRNKYVANCLCGNVRSVSGESPIRPVDKGMVGTDIIALIAVMK